VKKERFGVGRNARTKARGVVETDSRHVPDAMKRAVYERDGGRCAFVDSRGKRCEETGALEIDHVDGFARTHRHDVDELRLLCRAHNQHAAETMYGRAFMDAARQETRPGTC
jgi:5-methylcytosine-specific restriction endonuclease McrA